MNVLDLIYGAQATGRTRFAFELLPPLKGEGMEVVLGAINQLTEFDPAYINITCHREALEEEIRPDGTKVRHLLRSRPGTVGISAAIRDRYRVEVVPHLICGGHSKYDIEDSLIDMEFLGLHNVLALRGDKLPTEERFAPHPDGHRHAVDLVRQISAMNRGEFVDSMVDKCHRSHFSIGVAGYPETHSEATDPDSDIHFLREKVEAGAQYVITQLFFDNSVFFSFVKRCRAAGITVPIIPGIKPLSVCRHLEMLPRVFSTHIPEELSREVERFRDDRDAVRQIGTEWAINQSRELMGSGVPVLHYYTQGKAENIVRIAEAIF